MLMVVFGAGASYDPVPSRPPAKYGRTGQWSRPPLANELFCDNLLSLGRVADLFQCQPIVPYLQAPLSGESVEQVLERLREEASEYPKRHQQLAAIRYYLRLPPELTQTVKTLLTVR
jgi:hypothetical protein